MLLHYRSLTVFIIAAAAFGCRTENERNADVLLSEAMVVLDQAEVAMSAVEDPELNVAPLEAWIRLAETYDLMTEVVEQYPDTRIAAALERSDDANHSNLTTSSSDSVPVREEIHGLALRFLVLAINEGAEVDVWGDACARAPSDTWALMCMAGWNLDVQTEITCFRCFPPDLSSFVAHGHGRNALRHIRQLESEEIRLSALTSLAIALAWARAPELALETTDVLAEMEVAWAEAQEKLVEDQATVQNRRRITPGARVARAREGIVEAQATVGDIEGVFVTLDYLDPGVRSMQTRTALIKVLMELEDAVERQRVLDRVLSSISSDDRNEFLGAIAVAVAQTGDIQAAREIMDQITEQDIVKMGVLQAEISTAQAVAGDRAGALRALQPMTDRIIALQPTSTYEQLQRARVLGELAAAYIRAGNRETALTLASDISALDSLGILPPVARALAAEGDLAEAFEILVSFRETIQRAVERREVWPDSEYAALASFVRLVEARIEAGDLEGALTAAKYLGPKGYSYTEGRMFTRIVTEQARLGDLSGALATAFRIPATGNAYVSIEELTIIAFSFPESDDVRHAIEEHQLSAFFIDTIALTMAYAALRDWHRSMALAVTLEERWRRETIGCILRMFGSASDLNCLQQSDI
jgi:hypothetical protein